MPDIFQIFASNAIPAFLPAANPAQAVPCPLVRELVPSKFCPRVPKSFVPVRQYN